MHQRLEDEDAARGRSLTGKDRAADSEMGVTTYSGGWKMKMQRVAALPQERIAPLTVRWV